MEHYNNEESVTKQPKTKETEINTKDVNWINQLQQTFMVSSRCQLCQPH